MIIILLIIIFTFVCWKKKNKRETMRCDTISLDIQAEENVAYGENTLKISTEENVAYGQTTPQFSTEENVAYRQNTSNINSDETYSVVK